MRYNLWDINIPEIVKKKRYNIHLAHIITTSNIQVWPIVPHQSTNICKFIFLQLPWNKHTIFQMKLIHGSWWWHGPLARYVKLRVAHAPGMPGTFSSPPRVSDPDMHHGTCVTHVPWCMPESITSGILWCRWWNGSQGCFLSDLKLDMWVIRKITYNRDSNISEMVWLQQFRFIWENILPSQCCLS